MSFFKTVLALLLLVVAGARLGAQCGTISFTTPVVIGDNATFAVWYNTPPSTINSLDLYVSLGSAAFVSAVGNLGFSASYSSGFGAVRIRRTTAYNPTGNFKLCDITFSLPLNQSTNICLSAGSVVRPGGNCLPSNLMTNTCITYTMPSVTISASVVKIPTSSAMSGVSVKVIPSSGTPKTVQTYSQGTFSALIAPSSSFTATALRDDASSQCGISEYDVTLTQRVVQLLDNFSYPYELIAADVNRDGKVKTFDYTLMQQVILGYSSLSKEWEFIPFSNYNTIAMPNNPDPNLDIIVPTYSPVMQIGVNFNTFYGIKYGDVDGSGSSCATASFVGKTAQRTFVLGKAQVQKDKTVLIPVFGKQFDQEMLFSLGLQFDPSKIELLGLQAGALPEFSDSCYALDQDKRGLVNILWVNTKNKMGISIKSNEPLFYIRANILNTSTRISEKAVNLSFDRLQNLAFNVKNAKGETIGLEYEETEGGDDLLGLPNELRSFREGLFPNPFKDKLNLNINTTSSGQAILRLLSQDGRLLRTVKIETIAGQNSISIDQLNALPTGAILYQLILPNSVHSGKLIRN